MPDRVIRDEVLRSERYWSVSIEAQRFFIHLLLIVDDTARFSGKNYTLRAACYPGQAIDPEKLERLLAELVDVDLVRVYEHEQERYVFVPRFRQRLRFTKSRFPPPPNAINDISVEKTDSSQTQVRLESDSSPQKRSEEKRSEEKRSEEKKNKTKGTLRASRSAFVLPDWIPKDQWQAWVDARKKLRKAPTEWAMELAVRKLEELKSQGYQPARVLAESAFNGWAGLFPTKEHV